MSGQQPSVITTKKSKCRGNRPLQRFKRKCRKNGLDDDTISKLILNHASTNQSSNHRIIEEPHQVKNEVLYRMEDEAVEQQASASVVQVNKQKS